MRMRELLRPHPPTVFYRVKRMCCKRAKFWRKLSVNLWAIWDSSLFFSKRKVFQSSSFSSYPEPPPAFKLMKIELKILVGKVCFSNGFSRWVSDYIRRAGKYSQNFLINLLWMERYKLFQELSKPVKNSVIIFKLFCKYLSKAIFNQFDYKFSHWKALFLSLYILGMSFQSSPTYALIISNFLYECQTRNKCLNISLRVGGGDNINKFGYILSESIQ